MVEVSGLYVYPIKGARAQAVDSVEIDSAGLRGDRQFAVFKDGVRCSLKQIPSIMFLGACWQASNLVLTFPDTPEFVLDASSREPSGVERFRGSEIPVGDMGDAVADWLSAALGEAVRLCRITTPTPFVIPLPEFTEVHGQAQERFVDAAPVMLANTASLDDLNDRLAQTVDMARFRPNIVLTGLPAYGEDDLETFQFDAVALVQVAPCERCAVVTMDLDTAQTAKEPLATLARYRRRKNDYAGGVMFGSYLAVNTPGVLTLGEHLQS